MLLADARVLGVPTSHPTLKLMVMCMHVCACVRAWHWCHSRNPSKRNEVTHSISKGHYMRNVPSYIEVHTKLQKSETDGCF